MEDAILTKLKARLLSYDVHDLDGRPLRSKIVNAINEYLIEMRNHNIPIPHSFDKKILEMDRDRSLLSTAVKVKELLMICTLRQMEIVSGMIKKM